MNNSYIYLGEQTPFEMNKSLLSIDFVITILFLLPQVFQPNTTPYSFSSKLTLQENQVNSNLAVEVSTSATDALCNGESTGSVSVTASNGTEPYNYEWSTGDTGPDVIGLPAGTYSITVTDADGSTAEGDATINEPPILELNVTSANAACNGENSGSATALPQGGTEPYSYAWSNGETTSEIVGLLAGNYTVIVTDANGCTAEGNALIDEPPAIELTTSSTDVLCNSESTGSVSASASGGTEPYIYEWSTGDTGPEVTGLPAGIYTVKVADLNDCSAIAEVFVTEPLVLEVNLTLSDVLCNGETSGGAFAIAQGGTEPYTYEWSTGDTGGAINNLGAGSYDIKVTDANGCEISEPFTIIEPPILEVTVTSNDAACNGENSGSAAAFPQGGVEPYSFEWSNGETTSEIDELFAGNYTVTVTDANDCIVEGNALIDEPPAIDLTTSSTDVLCNGEATGSVSVTVNGGVEPYAYEWSTGDNGPEVLGLPAGVYSVIVTDASDCSITGEATILEPTALELEINSTDVLCNGDANGNINTTVSGGVEPYTYEWSNGETSPNITDLPADFYLLIVTDANGCIITGQVTINEPPVLDVTATTSDALCNGESSGSISASVSGGTEPYSYEWNTGDNSPDLDGLPAGDYSLTVTDFNGCIFIIDASIAEPPVLEATISSSDAICNGESTGNVSVAVQGGTEPYNYEWNTGDTSPDVNNLPTGNYSVTITDANGCTVEGDAFIDEPPAIELTTSSTDAICNGDANGIVEVVANFGFEPYSYQWNTGDNEARVEGLPAGNYSVTVTDVNGCFAEGGATIQEPPAVELSLSSTDALCNGEATGTASVTASFGVEPYTYEWSNGDSESEITGLNAGVYTVFVIDFNGCSAIGEITIGEPPVLQGEISSTDVLCNGEANGTANIQVEGGTTPYSYEWSTGNTSSAIEGLPVGTYNVTVTDGNGCIIIEDIIINEPDILELTIASTDVICFEEPSGTAIAEVVGGVTPYSFEWSTGDNTPGIRDLLSGIYTVTITDANGCVISGEVIIDEPPALTVTMSSTSVLCNGGRTGEARAEVNGGTPPYKYEWNARAVDPVVENAEAGNYSVTVTDANGCIVIGEVEVKEPPAIQATINVNNVLCFGGSTGSAQLDVTGGTAPFTYIWSTGSTESQIEGLSIGTYSFTITDANQCTFIGVAEIGQPEDLAIGFISDEVLCNNIPTATVQAIVRGGTLPYNYEWSTGGGTEVVEVLPQNDYIVRVTDANGCVITGSVSIGELPTFQMNLDNRNGDCKRVLAEVKIVLENGTAPYKLTWEGPMSGKDTLTTNEYLIRNLIGGEYEITVEDFNDCVISRSVELKELPTFEAEILTEDGTCDDPFGSIEIDLINGDVPIAIVWEGEESGRDTIKNKDVRGYSITNLRGGEYEIRITDANKCLLVNNVIIFQPSIPSMDLQVTNDLCGDALGAIEVTVEDGEAPFDLIWDGPQPGGAVIDVGNIGNGGRYRYLIEDLPGGEYDLKIIDANGCSVSESTEIIEASSFDFELEKIDSGCDQVFGSIIVRIEDGEPPFNILWTGPESGEVVINSDQFQIDNLPSGNYEVIVIDDSGCEFSDKITLAESTLFSFNLEAIDGDCNRELGEIVVTVEEGTAPFLIDWDGPQNGQSTFTSNEFTISDLPTGLYEIQISDTNDCDQTEEVFISALPPFAMNLDKQDGSCQTGLGSIFINLLNGVAPFKLSWQGPESGEATFSNNEYSINDLPSGEYLISIVDDADCREQASIAIEATENTLSIATTLLRDDCDQENGISVRVENGQAPFKLSWTGPTQGEDEIVGNEYRISPLTVGEYIITVIDVLGCQSQKTVVITENPLDLMRIIVQDITCEENSRITIFSNRPDQQFNLTWDGPSSGSTTLQSAPHILNDLPSGDYVFRIRDENGCQEEETITVNDLAVDLDLASQIQPGDCEMNNWLRVDISNGESPYSIRWSGPSTGAIQTEDNFGIIERLEIGDYSVFVSDQNGCIDSLRATIEEVDLKLFELNINNGQCGELAEVGVNILGEAEKYQLKWEGPVIDSITLQVKSYTIKDLPNGQYLISLIDTLGCIDRERISIQSTDSDIALSVETVDNECSQPYNLSLNIANGISPFSITWSGPRDGSAESEGNTIEIEDLIPGDYDIIVMDAAGCATNQLVTINEAPINIFSAKSTGGTNGQLGQIEVTIENGTPPFEVRWEGPIVGTATTNEKNYIISELPSGNYEVTLVDAFFCKEAMLLQVQNEGAALFANFNLVDGLCGPSNTVEISLGGGAKPYTIRWDGPEGNEIETDEESYTVPDLSSGDYLFTVRDADGVTIEEQISIETGETKLFELSSNNGSCGEPGQINVDIIAGTPGYSIFWEGPNSGNQTITSNTLEIPALPEGTYIITIIDANNCRATDQIEIEKREGNVNVGAEIVKDDCGLENSLSIEIIDGLPPFELKWFSEGASGGTIINESTIVPDFQPGQYELIVSDANGCEINTNFSVPFQENIDLLSIEVDNNGTAEQAGIIEVNILGGTPPYQLSWKGNAAGNETTSSRNFTIDDLPAGLYTVELIDANGCTSIEQASIGLRTANITGSLETFWGEAISGAEVSVSTSDGIVMTSISDEFGNFDLPVIPVGETYMIRPQLDSIHVNGISTYALFVGQRFILGLQPPQIYSPYQVIGGDANCNGSFTSLDLFVIQRLILGEQERFADCPSWVFVTESNELPQDFNTYNVFPFNDFEMIGLDGDTTANYVGVKVGDILGRAQPNYLDIPPVIEVRELLDTLQFTAENHIVPNGKFVDVTFTSEGFKDIASFQLGIDYSSNALEFVEFIPSHTQPMTNVAHGHQTGKLKVSWFSNNGESISLADTSSIFTIRFRAKSHIEDLSELIRLKDTVMPATAHRENGESLEVSLSFENDILTTIDQIPTQVQSTLYQNTPNPFHDFTTISFDLQESSRVNFSIQSINGTIVQMIEDHFKSGFHQIRVNKGNLEPGLYLYTLKTNNFTATKRMIVE